MKTLLFILLFFVGALFVNASQIPAWILGGGRPKRKNWKKYLAIGIAIYILILILVNTIL